MRDYPLLKHALSRTLKRLRENAGIGKSILALISDIDRIYITQLEQEKFRPALNCILYLGMALGMPASQLIGMAESGMSVLENAPIEIAPKKP